MQRRGQERGGDLICGLRLICCSEQGPRCQCVLEFSLCRSFFSISYSQTKVQHRNSAGLKPSTSFHRWTITSSSVSCSCPDFSRKQAISPNTHCVPRNPDQYKTSADPGTRVSDPTLNLHVVLSDFFSCCRLHSLLCFWSTRDFCGAEDFVGCIRICRFSNQGFGYNPKFARCLLLVLSLAFSLLGFAVQETFGVQRKFFAVVVLILELEKPVIMGTNPKTTLYVGESFIFCLAFHSR